VAPGISTPPPTARGRPGTPAGCGPAARFSGGAEPADRWTERRFLTRDCWQLHQVGEAPSRRAHRVMGQNQMPDGWAEAEPGTSSKGYLVKTHSRGSDLHPWGSPRGGRPPRESVSGAPCGGSGSVSMSPSVRPTEAACSARSGGGASTGVGGAVALTAGPTGSVPHWGCGPRGHRLHPTPRLLPMVGPRALRTVHRARHRPGGGWGRRLPNRSRKEGAREGGPRSTCPPLSEVVDQGLLAAPSSR